MEETGCQTLLSSLSCLVYFKNIATPLFFGGGGCWDAKYYTLGLGYVVRRQGTQADLRESQSRFKHRTSQSGTKCL